MPNLVKSFRNSYKCDLFSFDRCGIAKMLPWYYMVSLASLKVEIRLA
jgi:hypothetical protein